MNKNVAFYVVIIVFLVLGLVTSVGTAYLALRRPFNATPPAKATETISTDQIAKLTVNVSPTPILPTTNPTIIDLQIIPTEITAITTNTPVVNATPTLVTDTSTASTVSASPTPQATNICGLTDSQIFMLIGIEKDPSNSVTVAKVIYLVKIVGDTATPGIEYVSIPPDLWLSTPSLISKYSISRIQIGSLFAVVLNSESSSKFAGQLASAAIASVIKDNFNVDVDQYITADTDTITKMIDGLGGVAVNSPTEISGNGVDLPSGDQTINGTNAIALLDYFSNTQDIWGDINYQELILKGIHAKLNSPQNPYKTSGFLQSFKDSILTNLADDNIAQLDCTLINTPSQSITYNNIWQPLISSSADGLVVNDVNQASKMLVDIIGDQFLAVTATPTPTIVVATDTPTPTLTLEATATEPTATLEPTTVQTPTVVPPPNKHPTPAPGSQSNQPTRQGLNNIYKLTPTVIQ
jgi:LCP family protein required for cell wall assembly